MTCSTCSGFVGGGLSFTGRSLPTTDQPHKNQQIHILITLKNNVKMSKRGNQDEHEKRTEMPDEEMGEFEDMWEDEFASEEEAIASASEAEAEEVEMEEEKDTYLPGQAIAEDEVLIADLSVYEMLHSMNMEWPCLSFDFLHDALGQDRRSVRPPTLVP